MRKLWLALIVIVLLVPSAGWGEQYIYQNKLSFWYTPPFGVKSVGDSPPIPGWPHDECTLEFLACPFGLGSISFRINLREGSPPYKIFARSQPISFPGSEQSLCSRYTLEDIFPDRASLSGTGTVYAPLIEAVVTVKSDIPLHELFAPFGGNPLILFVSTPDQEHTYEVRPIRR